MTVAVSVCIPTYNGAAHLAHCLESVAAQTFRDFEVLLVDDGSTDATVQIAERHSHILPNLRIHKNERNLGLVANWNQCARLATGEWIKFVFQDDSIEPQCLTRMLDQASAPLVFCKRRFQFDGEVSPELIALYEGTPSLDVVCRTSQGRATADEVARGALVERRNFFGEPTASLIRRSAFQQFGPFNEDMRQICDLEYWVRVGSNTGVAFVGETLATFRFHQGSTTAANIAETGKRERIEEFDKLILLHEFTHGAHYARLRRWSSRVVPPRDLRAELTRKARWVRQQMTVESLRSGDDRSWVADWERLSTRYRHLEPPFAQVRAAARRFWDRHIGWRF